MSDADLENLQRDSRRRLESVPVAEHFWEIGEDYILGRADDELGVESVQLWPLERRGG